MKRTGCYMIACLYISKYIFGILRMRFPVRGLTYQYTK